MSASVLPRRLGALDIGPVFRDCFPVHRFVVVSNREPYEHAHTEDSEPTVRRPAGGLISALDPLLQAVGGVWIAWGSGDADRDVVDERDCVRVPPESASYTLRRLWLDDSDVHHYYYGYSNQFLWPLCHLRPALTRIRSRYWERYQAVNHRFAEAVIEEAGDQDAAIWFQDYHLAVAPAIVREKRPELPLAHFWHIPFPPLEIFRVATNAADLLEGMLANDLIGFHLPLFGDNFLRCAESLVGAEVDWSARAAHFRGHTCSVRALPISIDVDAFVEAASTPDAERVAADVRARFAPRGKLGLGVDRIDYSKGLEEKLTALDFLWDRFPEFRETFTYLQIAVPSRRGIEAYDYLNERIERLVWSINDRYGTAEWRPVHLVKDSLPWQRLAPLYRTADVCIVSSLQDGMNLVAKEYAACQVEEPAGVLVLSKFAGAAQELQGSVETNPYDIEEFAGRIHQALLMPEEERQERMESLRGSLRTIYDWMAETFQVWGGLSRGETPPLSPADLWSRVR